MAPKRRFFRFALICLPFLAASPCRAASWEGVYDGFIGPAHIVAAMSLQGGRYVYFSRPNDLGLILSTDGKRINAIETIAPDIAASDVKVQPRLVTGRWSLTEQGGKLVGTWTDGKGAIKRPIVLNRVSATANANNQPDTYDAQWLASGPQFLPQGDEIVLAPLAYTRVRDDLYGNVLPRLTHAPKNINMGAVNAVLEGLHRALVLEDRNCMQNLRSATALTDFPAFLAMEKNPRASEAQGEMKPVYASPTLFSVLVTRSRYCGGAHPATNIAAYTFDLVKARQITGMMATSAPNVEGPLSDLAASGLGAAFDLAQPQTRARFDDFWVSQFRASISKSKAVFLSDGGQAADEPCAQSLTDDFAQNGSAISLIAYPLPQGLAIQATGFPHALAVCVVDFAANPLIIPYAALKPFLKPGQYLLPVQP